MIEALNYEDQTPIVQMDVMSLRGRNGGPPALFGTFNITEDFYADETEGEGWTKQFNKGWKENYEKHPIPKWCPSKYSKALQEASNLTIGDNCHYSKGHYSLDGFGVDGLAHFTVGPFLEYGTFQSYARSFKKGNPKRLLFYYRIDVTIKPK
ncbi:Protein of unknown function [Gryllus bimaculatus]|nr:Protein of unknown function [Gryllus bimaculatus]